MAQHCQMILTKRSTNTVQTRGGGDRGGGSTRIRVAAVIAGPLPSSPPPHPLPPPLPPPPSSEISGQTDIHMDRCVT
jgi:hypothetical protein